MSNIVFDSPIQCGPIKVDAQRMIVGMLSYEIGRQQGSSTEILPKVAKGPIRVRFKIPG
jgi:hypothetical protein